MKAHGKDYGVANVEGGVNFTLMWNLRILNLYNVKKHFHCVVYGSKNATDKEMSFVV